MGYVGFHRFRPVRFAKRCSNESLERKQIGKGKYQLEQDGRQAVRKADRGAQGGLQAVRPQHRVHRAQGVAQPPEVHRSKPETGRNSNYRAAGIPEALGKNHHAYS